MNYFIDALKKYADFTGRARRKEYWMFYLIYMILLIVISILDAAIGVGLFSLIFTLGMLIPSISIAARRLHDTGRSGWWQLIAFIPLIGFIILIVFLVQDGSDANEYGENPKSGVSL
tara:strand:+ start:63 stop:413 length:351 start_codon:yes stop_codon:yes gene_type:complete